jgi:hypothetical protein
MSPRQRKWLTAAAVLALAAVAPLMMLLGKTALHHPGRRALVFDEVLWRAEAGRLDPESDRGLMVPGLLATGRLAAKREEEVRALLGEPDCPPEPGGPFALGPRLAYWVGKVGTAKPQPGEPPPVPGCLYLRLVDGRVVEWRTAPAPGSASGAATDAAIRRDLEDARAAGLPGTPSFVVGRVVDGTVEGARLVGAQPFEAFETRVRALLSGAR